MRLIRFRDEAAWIAAVVAQFAAAADEVRSTGRRALHLCLAGGTTPESVYRAMAALPLRGTEVHLWLGDERDVDTGDESRNGRLVAACFSHAAWDPRPHPWPSGDRAAACHAYATELAAALGPRPAFDLVLLGLGADGHAASLFPGDPILDVRDGLAAPSVAPNAPFGRLSLTYTAFAAARRLRFLVRGPEKAAAVDRLAADDAGLPAARIGGLDKAILYLE